jgi:hypothetical protein
LSVPDDPHRFHDETGLIEEANKIRLGQRGHRPGRRPMEAGEKALLRLGKLYGAAQDEVAKTLGIGAAGVAALPRGKCI